MKLQEIRAKFKELYERGFIDSERRGPTGIGFTIENALGLKESNISMPDFGSIELKSTRIGPIRYITLFTLNRIAWNPSAKEVINRYGYWNEKRKRKDLYCSVKCKPNNRGLFLSINDDYLRIISPEEEEIGNWSIEAVRDKVIEKIQTMLFVRAERRKIDKCEQFWFREAVIFSGCNYNAFFDLLLNNIAFIDIRMHIKSNGVVRNHGTGFRLPEPELRQLYLNETDLMK